MSSRSTTHRQKDTRQTFTNEEPEAVDDAGEGWPDMARVCRILARQVEALDTMFRHVRELALQEDRESEAFERLSRLALRAQSQTARTAMVLSRLCPPPPPRVVEEEPDPYEEALIQAVLGRHALPLQGSDQPASSTGSLPVDTTQDSIPANRPLTKGEPRVPPSNRS